MDNQIECPLTLKDRIASFCWQHILLLFSLFLMTFGVALCVRSALGSSVISAIPLAFTLAGEDGLAPALTVGQYTYIMNFILVAAQILVLRRRFEAIQLFQLLIGFVFGALLDVNMTISVFLNYGTINSRIMAQLVGCTILAVGIAMEVRCGSVTMPGEGLPAAISKLTGAPFPRIKIMVDITLVAAAVLSGYIFFGTWLWPVVGPGTLFAMLYVGAMVKAANPYMGWFDRLLCYRPGFRRYIYGLARYIRR